MRLFLLLLCGFLFAHAAPRPTTSAKQFFTHVQQGPVFTLKDVQTIRRDYQVNAQQLGIEVTFKTSDNSYMNKLATSLKNIGPGMAKNVKGQWSYNDKKVTELIHEKYPYPKQDEQFSFSQINLNEEKEIWLPVYFMQVLAQYLHLPANKIPNLRLDIEYESPVGKVIKKHFRIEFNIDGDNLTVTFH